VRREVSHLPTVSSPSVMPFMTMKNKETPAKIMLNRYAMTLHHQGNVIGSFFLPFLTLAFLFFSSSSSSLSSSRLWSRSAFSAFNLACFSCSLRKISASVSSLQFEIYN
jgi:hypothetical protein